MTKKLTKKDKFANIIAKYNLDTEDREFLEGEIELLVKKASKDRKPTATQVANMAIKEEILSVLSSGATKTCTEIAKAIQPNHTEDITVNKVSALMKQLCEDKKVIKTVEKRKSYFSLAE